MSGRLSYYDLPLAPGQQIPFRNPVHNKVDWGAWVPFYAHVQYWKNSILRQELFDAVGSRIK